MTRQQYNRFVNCALLAVDKDRIRRINQDTLHIHNACCHCSLRYLLSLRVSSAALQIILLTEYSWGGSLFISHDFRLLCSHHDSHCELGSYQRFLMFCCTRLWHSSHISRLFIFSLTRTHLLHNNENDYLLCLLELLRIVCYRFLNNNKSLRYDVKCVYDACYTEFLCKYGTTK